MFICYCSFFYSPRFLRGGGKEEEEEENGGQSGESSGKKKTLLAAKCGGGGGGCERGCVCVWQIGSFSSCRRRRQLPISVDQRPILAGQQQQQQQKTSSHSIQSLSAYFALKRKRESAMMLR